MTQISVPSFISVASFLAISSPSDGDLVTVQIDAANAINCTFRYNASSVSAYKWEATSGIDAYVSNLGPVTPSGFSTLTDLGVTYTLPLGGDMHVEWGADVKPNNSAFGSNSTVAIWNDTTAQISAKTVASGSQADHDSLIQVERLTGQPRGRILRLRAITTSSGGSPGPFNNIWITVRPIRVSTT